MTLLVIVTYTTYVLMLKFSHKFILYFIDEEYWKKETKDKKEGKNQQQSQNTYFKIFEH